MRILAASRCTLLSNAISSAYPNHICPGLIGRNHYTSSHRSPLLMFEKTAQLLTQQLTLDSSTTLSNVNKYSQRPPRKKNQPGTVL